MGALWANPPGARPEAPSGSNHPPPGGLAGNANAWVMPTAKLEGTEVFYRDAGSTHRDVVVLLHAFPLNSGMWSRQIAALEKSYRVIAPDYRGLGRSASPGQDKTTTR